MKRKEFYKEPALELFQVPIQTVVLTSPNPGEPGGEEPYNPGGDF